MGFARRGVGRGPGTLDGQKKGPVSGAGPSEEGLGASGQTERFPYIFPSRRGGGSSTGVGVRGRRPHFLPPAIGGKGGGCVP